jgi:hypothetical protein
MPSRSLKIEPRTSGTPTDSTESNTSETVSTTAIAALAYQLWQARGCPIGSDQEDGFEPKKT